MKKKSHKRMMDGGMARNQDMMVRIPRPKAGGKGSDMIKRPMPIGRPMPSRPVGDAGTKGADQIKRPMPMPTAPPPRTPPVAMPVTSSQTGSVAGIGPIASRVIGGGSVPGETIQRQVMRKGGKVQGKKMRGGGLARKGVGMALAAGGLAKRAGGCAKRGVGRGKMV